MLPISAREGGNTKGFKPDELIPVIFCPNDLDSYGPTEGKGMSGLGMGLFFILVLKRETRDIIRLIDIPGK
jgi:hypothetical protein